METFQVMPRYSMLSIQNKSLDGELQLTELNLDFLEPFLGDYSQFKSTLNSQLSFTGPIMKPKLKGQFVLDDLLLKGEVTPVEIESGNIDVNFSGYGANLTAAVDTPDGQLQATGEADWRDLKKWQTNLRVFADELMADLPPMVKVKVIPDMTISASLKQARIDGTIALPWGKIVVEELPPSAIGVSKDQVLLNEHLEPESQSRRFRLVSKPMLILVLATSLSCQRLVLKVICLET